MNWTKAKAMAWADLRDRLGKHGLSDYEVDALLQCERTLNRWACSECGDGGNWSLEREGEDGEGRPIRRWVGPQMPGGDPKPFHVRDLEAGALRRANAIAKAHGLTIYHQGDPRGCSLYIIRPGDVPDGQCVTGYYTRGIAICIE